MMTPAERIVVGALGFIVIDLPPLGAFAYALKKSRKERREAELPLWRRIAANLGFLAVAAQAGVLLSIWIWPEFTRMPLLSQWARWVFPTFLVALPFGLAGKGVSRWWLLSASFYLFAICFMVVLTP